MEIYFVYDWISATMPTDKSKVIEQWLSLGEEITNVPTKPRFGYTAAKGYESGAVVMWNSERPEMGYHLILSGAALNHLAGTGQDSLEVLKYIAKMEGRVSRLDLAIDVFDSGLTPDDLSKRNRKPVKGKGRTPKYTLVGDAEDGWTIYIGSRSSEKFLRIYHKGLEQNEKDNDWLRIELECKSSFAHYLGAQLANATVEQAYDMASQLTRAMVDFPHQNWQRSLSSRSVHIALPKKPKTDTLKWLLDVCAPSLARLIASKPNTDVLGAFSRKLHDELSQYQSDDN